MLNNNPISSLYEIYDAVTNDCYIYLFSLCFQNVRDSIVKYISEKEKENPTLNIIIFILRQYAGIQNQLKSDFIISFTSKYLYNMYELTTNEKIKELKEKKVNNNYEFCLAYIALLGYKYTLIGALTDEDKEKFFNFAMDEYENFSILLNKYNISNIIKEFYDKSTFEIKNESTDDKYLNLIKTFDQEKIFIEDITHNKLYYDLPPNENDLNSTKNDSSEKEKKENSINELNENISINMDEKFKDIKVIENNSKNESNKNSSIEEISKIDDINNKEKIDDDKKEKNIPQENLKNEINDKNIVDVVSNIQKEIKENKIQIKFEFILRDIKFIQKFDKLNYESMINSKYLKVQKKNSEYLEQYIGSLKNTIINLSNPYDFNFWRKIANIILKNIFVILNMKKFDLRQESKQSILNQLYSKFKEKKIYINNNIKNRLILYENNLKIKKEINNLSDAADKKRDYNLIIIYKDDKPDIISSLSTDFLFYLKEKGNKFNHFDEVILIHILFNNLNIEENEFNFVEEEKEGKISQDRKNNEKNTKEIKIKLDNNNIEEQKENNNNDVKKEVKIKNNNDNKEEKKGENINNNIEEINKVILNSDKKKEKKNLENIISDNQKKNVIANENKLENTNEKNDEIKKELNHTNINEIINEPAKTNEEKKNENNNLNKKKEIIYTGDELIKMLKNPLYFQNKNIQKKNVFNSMYTEIDNLKIYVGNKLNNEEKDEIITDINDVKSKIIELKKLIDNYFETYKIDIKKIEILQKDKQLNLDEGTKKIIDIYSKVQSLNGQMDDKIQLYKDIDKKISELDDSITSNENEINEEIKKIQTSIAKIAKLIKINNVFDEYKQDLKNKIKDENEIKNDLNNENKDGNENKKDLKDEKKNENEYKRHSDIYNEKNIDEFTLDKLYNFLEEHLKNYSYSIGKHDITNYNLYIEIIKNYPELYSVYKDDLDVEFNVSNSTKK